MTIKGLIFDLDGVITNTATLHYEAWKIILEEHNILYSKKENEALKGLSRKDTLTSILKMKKIVLEDSLIDKICFAKNSLYVSYLNNKITKNDILPGIINLLDDAKKMKLRMIIASSSRNATLILKKLEIEKYFDGVVNLELVKNGKPAPDIYLQAISDLNLLPQECIGFEDAYFGLMGLLGANINTVSITYGVDEMYVNNTFIARTTLDLNLGKILNYFSEGEKINQESIYHTSYGRYAYQDTKGWDLSIILRTKKNNVNSVKVRMGDPFRFHKKNDDSGVGVTQIGGDDTTVWTEDASEFMTKYLSDDLFDYYKSKITSWTKRVRYAFEIEGHDFSKIIFGEKGFFMIDEPISKIGFTWGYLDEGNIFDSPKWVAGTIWYQIFVERFWNGDKSNDNPNTLEWNSAEPSTNNFFGGDLQGIIDKLEHLVDLGITGIYLTPIFKANTNHKYDTEDYSKIDPFFGSKEKFKELIKKCHLHGIKVMLDAVFNHCGDKFPQWLDVLDKKEKSSYLDWFYIKNIDNLKPPSEYPDNFFMNVDYVYETFAFVHEMPKLNLQTIALRNYLKNIIMSWTKLGIDAWRLDVANEVPLNFWRSFRIWVNKINPNIYIVGEIWYNASLYLNGDLFDGVMNYPLRECIINSIKNNWSTNKIKKEFSKYFLLYNDGLKRGMFNLLSSHDTPRILTVFKNDKKKYKIAYRILFHMLGSVCIYYGDEIGMDGEHDPGCRKCMQWDDTKWDKEIYLMFKKLIKMRKDYISLTNGEFEFIDYHNDVDFFSNHQNKELINFKIYSEHEIIFCILNLTNEIQETSIIGQWLDIYKNKLVEGTIQVKPNDMFSLIKKA